jgi:putative DNA primase/helicase
MLDNGMFAPLLGEKIAGGADAGTIAQSPELTPIIPVPFDAPPCRWRHPKHGEPVATWAYRDADGELVGYAARVEHLQAGKRKKDVFPLTYCRIDGARAAWRAHAVPALRPLYRLPELITIAASPVVVTEGEKTADAVSRLFPEHLGTTSMGGARSANASDWAPLAERNVIIWPDHDEAGRRYAKDVAVLATAAGATSVTIVEVPEDWPESWDLADLLPEGVSTEMLSELLQSARQWTPAALESQPAGGGAPRPAYVSFGNYQMGPRGLLFGPDEPEKPPIWLSAPFEVLAHTRDARGYAWGKLLRWRDLDEITHQWAMPARALGGGREEVWRELLDAGLQIASSAASRNRLAEYLSAVRVSGRARAVSRIGWYAEEKGAVFVLPDATYGEAAGERVLWQTETRAETAYHVIGTVEDWRDEVARRCVGNSRVVFAVSAAYAPPLLTFSSEENGGFHFVGSSRAGKTTVLRAAASVWGGGGINGYLRSWRATSNGLESIAEAHCDTLLCLDEMGQVEAREAGEIAYMLANGFGKGRARRDGSARQPAQWRLLFLSSGEVSLADKMAEIGKRSKAGQEVRLVDIPADAGAGRGAFEKLNGAVSAGAFAEELRQATEQYYGAPIRRFLELLTARYVADPAGLAEVLRASRDDFLAAQLPEDASGQVRSVCGRFALVAAAGSLATAFGLTGWPDDEADRAAAGCFRAWLERRGSAGDHDIEAGIRQAVAYIEAHGSSRFEAAWQDGAERVINRVGFRRREDDKPWRYMLLPEQWRSEVAKGFDAPALARAMIDRKLIIPGGDGKAAKPIKVPGYGTMRLYVLAPGIIGDVGGNDAG